MQFLFQHNANPNYPDADGHTCVFYSRAAANHLSGIPTQYPKNLQITCPLHPNPITSNGSTSSNGSKNSTSTKDSTSTKSTPTDCNCIIFELLSAQSSANALVEVLIGLQNSQYLNSSSLDFALIGSNYGTLGRNSLGPNLSLNGKCGNGSLV